MKDIAAMKQRNTYTPRHATPDRKRRPESMPEQHMRNEPDVQAQIRHYKAQNKEKQAKYKRIKRGLFALLSLALLIVVVAMITKGLRRDELRGVWTLD